MLTKEVDAVDFRNRAMKLSEHPPARSRSAARDRSVTLRCAQIVFAIAYSGCATARFPLCPRIAERSYPLGKPGETVNMFVRDEAKWRQVRIRPLSHFAADFSGSKSDIRWFSGNYSFVLCAFDPRQVINVDAIYTSCMSHALEWLAIVRSQPENLLLTETKFKDNCAVLPP